MQSWPRSNAPQDRSPPATCLSGGDSFPKFSSFIRGLICLPSQGPVAVGAELVRSSMHLRLNYLRPEVVCLFKLLDACDTVERTVELLCEASDTALPPVFSLLAGGFQNRHAAVQRCRTGAQQLHGIMM